MTPLEMADIHRAAFIYGRAWSADEFESLLAGPFAHLVTAKGGFAVLQVIPPEAELLTIAIHPSFQRQGLGAALLGKLRETAARQGASQMFLEVDAMNTPALTLYEKAGFVHCGRRSQYYRHADGSLSDAIQMSCDLDAEQTGSRHEN